jgi:hypothetical protein
MLLAKVANLSHLQMSQTSTNSPLTATAATTVTAATLAFTAANSQESGAAASILCAPATAKPAKLIAKVGHLVRSNTGEGSL